MSEHVVPVKNYASVFVALIILTGATTGIAYIDLGAFNTVVALAIAVLKMLLVVMFFMHLKASSPLIKVVFIGAFLWLAIMVTLTLGDELTRNWSPNPSGWGPSITSTANTNQ